jgi:hypothetical protein
MAHGWMGFVDYFFFILPYSYKSSQVILKFFSSLIATVVVFNNNNLDDCSNDRSANDLSK